MTIVRSSALTAQQGVTIAIRYAASRVHNQNEQVLSYQTQMHRILPDLAEVYAMTFAGKRYRSSLFANSN